MTTSPIFGLPFLSNGQSQPDVTVNTAVLLLQLAFYGVASVGENDPPAGS